MAARCLRGATVFAALVTLTACLAEPPEANFRRVWSLYLSGNLPEAAKQASTGASRFQRSSPSWFWRFRLLQAESLLGQAKLQEASALLQDPIPGSLESGQLEVRRLIDQADACSKSGRRPQAIEILERTRPMATDPDLQIRIDVLEGGILARLGELDRAVTVLNRALVHAVNRKDAYQQASALLNLSYCRKRFYQYAEATEYGLRALSVAEKRGMRRVAAVASMNLGSFYTFLGDFDRASKYQENAIHLLSEIPDRGNLLIALGELGLLYKSQRKFDKAIVEYQKAFDLARYINSNSDAARNADNLATAFIELKRWDDADRWNEKARVLATPDSGSEPYIQMNAARIAHGRGFTGRAISLCKNLFEKPGLHPALIWDSHAFLGSVYAENGNHDEADRQFTAALEVIDKTRSDLLRAELQITFLSRLITFHQEYVELLVERNDDASALRIVESSRARVLAERLGLNISGAKITDVGRLAQLAKAADTVMLSFWIAPKRSFAWLISRGGIQRFTLPPASEIESLVSAYRRIIERSLQDPIKSADPNGQKLWTALLGGIAPRILKGSRVVVIPDGPLHRLNLETLPVPGPRPHYWLEDVELAVAPSLSIAASQPEPIGQREASLLLVGAPDYSGEDYTPLKKAGSEIRAIQALFPGTFQAVFTGPQASPSAYRDSMPDRFSIIHFAAHAEANSENPLESAVVLSHQANGYKLYARDIMNMPIRADLVTISACRSAGIRAYAGEGLIGFSWAFLQAGARAVVAGLWDVSDTSTQALMGEFYGGIASRNDTVWAMRRAKLSLLNQPAYQKPYFWAPFQVYIRCLRK